VRFPALRHTAFFGTAAAVLAFALPLFAEEPQSVEELCRRWDALEKQIRDGTVSPFEAEQGIAALHTQLAGALKGTIPAPPLVFPLRGFNATFVGGKNGNGYVASRYDFYDNGRHSGHPALDIFIDDDNEDTLSDRTGKKVEVIAATAGMVTAVNTEWDKSSEIRGGRYVWVFSPALDRYSYYAHLDSVAVRPGEVVAAGATLGVLGRTGKNAARRRSPTHLHLMCLVFDGKRLTPKNLYKELTRAYVVPDGDDRADYRWVSGAAAGRVRDIPPPAGFTRTQEAEGSFGAWLQNLPLNIGTAAIGAAAGKNGPLRGIGGLMKLRAEYLYAKRLAEKIQFIVAPGFGTPYVEWLDGYRLSASQDVVAWLRTTAVAGPPDYSYAGFKAFANAVLSPADPASLTTQLAKVGGIGDVRVGDVFVNAGATGSAMIVVDTAVDGAGRKKFLALTDPAAPPSWFDARTFSGNDLMRFAE